MFEYVFFLSSFIVMYVYCGYPIMLSLLSCLFSKPVRQGHLEPKVTIIITAYNEEKNIRQRIENCMDLNYPKEKLEIIVASDCSTDNTDKIVKDYKMAGVVLCRLKSRGGKTLAQNTAVLIATGEIIIFTDATTHCRGNMIVSIVRNFADEEVGCVAGRLKYYSEGSLDSSVSGGEGLFWRYENFMKKKESLVSSIIGADGPLYAIRKGLYVPLRDYVISDLVVPLKIVSQRYRSVYEPNAIALEKSTTLSKSEIKYRCRVVLRGCRGIWEVKELLNPFKYGIFTLQIFSHKLLRWFVPILLVLAYISNVCLVDKHILYTLFYVMQSVFYLFALIGYGLERKGKNVRLFATPFYFCIANLGVLWGLALFFSGRKLITWDTSR
ncbi:MAG: glycosyltransferase family 2 protein [Candidatus Scalindua rubra]|uniref:Glycosyltransferase 2-like domain-containing protein n=1 Tax=Candidatus Scalindua brodae TaxID=237368 RepID=A0A0B0EFL6_9BACT|nr:MAG: hypothetical protein SCABRO_03385 [Candidatus Scalindua brodae]MBZ0108436.1 glycosyltransferase family 2 protein [Candidatus Scalindua rubra]TWU28796.1 Beta-monoglucosyldiacylglycerol synthase [Candidatus Brocadiaceae bacterium S225]